MMCLITRLLLAINTHACTNCTCIDSHIYTHKNNHKHTYFCFTHQQNQRPNAQAGNAGIGPVSARNSDRKARWPRANMNTYTSVAWAPTSNPEVAGKFPERAPGAAPWGGGTKRGESARANAPVDKAWEGGGASNEALAAPKAGEVHSTSPVSVSVIVTAHPSPWLLVPGCLPPSASEPDADDMADTLRSNVQLVVCGLGGGGLSSRHSPDGDTIDHSSLPCAPTGFTSQTWLSLP